MVHDSAGLHRARQGKAGDSVCVCMCVCACWSVRLRAFAKLVCFAFASVAEMASSGVDLLLADCLAVGQEVSERE